MNKLRIEGFPELGRDQIVAGRRFLFLLPGFQQSTRLSDRHVPDIINLTGFQQLDLFGLHIKQTWLEEITIAAICPNKMLYDPRETIYLLVACPAQSGRKVTLEINKGREKLSNVEILINDLGCALYTISELCEGDYTVKLTDTEIRTDFTVARYCLAPLQASFEKEPEMRECGRSLAFAALLTTYGAPVEGKVTIELMQGQKRVDSLQTQAQGGRVEAEVSLPSGEQQLSLNFLIQDRSASLPLRGGKESERRPFTANPLGRVISFSTMPPGEEERGLYFSEGPANNAPFLIAECVTENGRLEIRGEQVEALKVVVVDPVHRNIEELSLDDTASGNYVSFAVPDPYGVVFIGAIIAGNPYEAYSIMIHPQKLKIEIETPKEVLPGDEAIIHLSHNQGEEPVAMLVTIVDGRAVTPHTVVSSYASRIKRGGELAVGDMEPGSPQDALEKMRQNRERRQRDRSSRSDLERFIINTIGDFLGGTRRDLFEGGGSHNLYQSFGPSSSGMEINRCCFSAPKNEPSFSDTNEPSFASEAVEIFSKSPDEEIAQIKAPEIRDRFPETVLCRLVTVSEKTALAFHAPQNITTLNLMVQAVAGYAAKVVEKKIEVSKDLYGEFFIPPYVGAKDQAEGRLFVKCQRGEFQARVTRNGKKLALSTGTDSGSFSFAVTPGEYEAVITNNQGENDTTRVVVSEPGKFRFKVDSIKILEPGQCISVSAGPQIESIAVLPGIDDQLKLVTRVTASYEHLCCEQTAAKIVAAAFMYTGGDDDARREAEAIILAGIARENQMYVANQGFKLYPHSGLSEYYGRLTVRYLQSALTPLARMKTSPALQDACAKGIEMAVNAGRALAVEIPPARISSCRDAYEIMTNSSSPGKKQEAIRFAAASLVSEGQLKAIKANGSAVNRRAETAFAAATLFLEGKTYLSDAVKAANWVAAHLTEKGAWYSTVDSIAGMAMLEAMSTCPGGYGRLLLNGREMTVQESLEFQQRIESVELPADFEGRQCVRIIQTKEENWDRFMGAIPIQAGFQSSSNEWISKAQIGDLLHLVVRLPDGYQDGDICHICLPPCLSFVFGGGQVKKMTIDFAGKNEIKIPVAVTGTAKKGQHFAICVRNMFEEERGGSCGAQKFIVST